MTALRYLVYLFALVGLMAAGLLVYRNFIADHSSYFATYEAIATSGLIERGWAPPALPHSATDISESHDVSSNFGSGDFKFHPEDTSIAESTCTLLLRSPLGKKFVCPPFEQQVFILVLMSDGTGRYESLASEI